MRALVTGGAGQDGMLLIPLLIKNGYDVISVTRNHIFYWNVSGKICLGPNKGIENPQFCNEILEEFKPNLIFHLAAIHGPSTSGVNESLNYLPLMRACHVQITINILEWMKKYSSYSKLIYPLTSQLYKSTDFPRHINESSLANPTNFYAETKLEAWNLIKHYRHTHDLWVACAILFRHTSKFAKSHFLYPTLARALHYSSEYRSESKFIEVFDALSTISMCAASDIIDGLMNLSRLDRCEDLVFGDNIGFTIRELLQSFVTYELNKKWENFTLSSRIKVPQPYLLPDITRATYLLKWQPKVTHLELLRESYLSFLS
jgi:GDPmannose 4,6-dehydratase